MDLTNEFLSSYLCKDNDKLQALAQEHLAGKSVEKKAKFLGLHDEFQGFLEKYAEFKQSKRTFAFENKYPIFSKRACEFSNKKFTTYYYKYPVGWREDICHQIKNASHNFDVKTSPIVDFYSQQFDIKKIDLNKVAWELSTIHEAAEKAVKVGGHEKLARLLHKVELVQRAKNDLPDVVRTVLEECQVPLSKQASKEINLVTSSYTLDKLASVPKTIYEKALGSDIAETLVDKEAMEKIILTLPRGDKTTLAMYLEGHFNERPTT